MLRILIGTMFFVSSASLAEPDAQPASDASRGELLYTTHCISCHHAEVHWRDKKVVSDGQSLRREVRRWQDIAGLGWNDEDIEQVAQYLQTLHYRHLAPD